MFAGVSPRAVNSLLEYSTPDVAIAPKFTIGVM
jgi:hypothetical protein